MQKILATVLAAVCSLAWAADPERPRATSLPERKQSVSVKKPRARVWTVRDIASDYWNNQWFHDAVENFAKSGTKPKVKRAPGVRTEFFFGTDEKRLRLHCVGVGGLGEIIEIRPRGRGFVAGVMWIDDNVVPWWAIVEAKEWVIADGARTDSR